jgi:hypothetical protein
MLRISITTKRPSAIAVTRAAALQAWAFNAALSFSASTPAASSNQESSSLGLAGNNGTLFMQGAGTSWCKEPLWQNGAHMKGDVAKNIKAGACGQPGHRRRAPAGFPACITARHGQAPRATAEVITGIDTALSAESGHLHRQAAFAMLRVCVNRRPCHLLRCACPPSDAGPYAQRFDDMFLAVWFWKRESNFES